MNNILDVNLNLSVFSRFRVYFDRKDTFRKFSPPQINNIAMRHGLNLEYNVPRNGSKYVHVSKNEKCGNYNPNVFIAECGQLKDVVKIVPERD